MRVTLRIVQAIAIGPTFVYALHAYCYVPLHCNVVEKELETRTSFAYRILGTLKSEVMARNNLDDLKACAAHDPTNVNDSMIAAANFAILGQSDAAVREYQNALIYDRRPEIYLNMGLDLLQLHRTAEAERALVTAALFNPAVVDDIPYEAVQASVRRQVSATFASWSAEHPSR